MGDTAKSLQERWDERDNRYARRRRLGVFQPITPDEESSIRAFRKSEIDDLPTWEQVPARLALAAWAPARQSR